MWDAVLAEGESGRGRDSCRSSRRRLRLLRSGAAPLGHVDAVRLRSLFPGAEVLPTYSMTECMPIASPPRGYELDRPGSVGPPLGGLEVRIVDSGGGGEEALGTGEVGEICLRGGSGQLFHGYGMGVPPPTQELEGQDRPSFFRTGDLGSLDKDGWLYHRGRLRESINRGGELISPLPIEEALAGHPAVEEAMAFSAPHETLQEAVGVAVVERGREGGAASTCRPSAPGDAPVSPPRSFPRCSCC